MHSIVLFYDCSLSRSILVLQRDSPVEFEKSNFYSWQSFCMINWEQAISSECLGSKFRECYQARQHAAFTAKKHLFTSFYTQSSTNRMALEQCLSTTLKLKVPIKPITPLPITLKYYYKSITSPPTGTQVAAIEVAAINRFLSSWSSCHRISCVNPSRFAMYRRP